MTEEEWLAACADPEPMLEWLQGRGSERKLVLFACACCLRVLRLMKDDRSRHALDVAFRWADGTATEGERDAAAEAASDAWEEAPFQEEEWYAAYAASHAISACYPHDPKEWEHEYDPLRYFQPWAAAREALNAGDSQVAQIVLLRDIFGNPFRPVSLDPAWLSLIVSDLAQATYDQRIMPSGELAPSRLAILADALEDAGCDDDGILSHLRSAGPHVRGCWALDLVLGKE